MNFKYPYTNFHELNLDWLIAEINKIKKQIEDLPDLDEKIKELEEMLADLEATLARSLGMGIVDNSNFNLYAQILPDANSRFNGSMYAQGFCIGDHAGVPYATQTFIELDSNNDVVSQLITMTDMMTGQRMISNVHTDLEHANSITYVPPLDRYVVATAGAVADQGMLVEIDKSGNTYHVHYLDAPMFAVAYNNDVIYTLGGHTLYKYDTDFNLIESVELDLQQGTFTYQGIAADDYFLYIFNGNTIPANTAEYNINRVSVFSHAGLPVKQVIMRYPLEIEEGDFLDGEFIISSNTTHAALLLKADMYARNRIHSFGEPLDNIDLNQNGIEIHVKEDYTDFLVDGSNDHPLSAITWLMLWLRNSTDRMNIKIDTDINQFIDLGVSNSLSFRRCPNTIFDIDAQGNKLPNLLFDGGTLYLNNAVLPGIDGATTIQFFGNRFVGNNLQFGVDHSTVTPLRFITAYSTCELDTLKIRQETKDGANIGWMFFMNGAGYVRNFNFPAAPDAYLDGIRYKLLLNGGFTADGTFPFTRVIVDKQWTHLTSAKIISNDANMTYALADINYPVMITKVGSSTITDIPASVVGSIVYYEVNVFRTSNLEFIFHMADNTAVYYRRGIS